MIGQSDVTRTKVQHRSNTKTNLSLHVSTFSFLLEWLPWVHKGSLPYTLLHCLPHQGIDIAGKPPGLQATGSSSPEQLLSGDVPEGME